MTLADFRDLTKNLPEQTELRVWDMGQGGEVGVEDITWRPAGNSLTFEPRNEAESGE